MAAKNGDLILMRAEEAGYCCQNISWLSNPSFSHAAIGGMGGKSPSLRTRSTILYGILYDCMMKAILYDMI